MHVSKTEVTKAKVNLLRLVMLSIKIFLVSHACHKYWWSLGDFLTKVSGPSDAALAQDKCRTET